MHNSFQVEFTDIAIIGMSGRFPDANNIEQFWENILAGKESIRDFTDEEVQASGVKKETINQPGYVKRGAVLDDIEYFDAEFFDFTPYEAKLTDPQQRIFLECAWEALELAGYAPRKEPQNIGVYGSMSISTYLLNHINKSNEGMNESLSYPILIGNDKDFLCTRVSYKCNLTGPSLTVQTACSSSLTAIHLACQSLINGECEMALAGGVSITLPQQSGYLYKEGGILSKDGFCRAFDHHATGTVKGNGCAIILLKPLEKALEDRDTIYAVIKSTALNNDAHIKIGFTAPSIQGQSQVIQEAIQMAGISPEDIEYVETHGTGTTLGDPIEIKALTEAYGSSQTQWCAIGSLKPNIGHLDAAAGAAGLIKTALVLRDNVLPPSINFEAPNPEIDFLNSPFYVNQEKTERDELNPIQYAGVSSFGLGGTNAHAILQKAPTVQKEQREGPHLFILSGKTKQSVETLALELSKTVQKATLSLSDISYTLALGRSEFDFRTYVVAADLDELASSLKTVNPTNIQAGTKTVSLTLSSEWNPSFYAHLMQNHPTYRELLDQLIERIAPHLHSDQWFDEEAPSESDQLMMRFISVHSWCQWIQQLGIPISQMTSLDLVSDFVAASISDALTTEQAVHGLLEHPIDDPILDTDSWAWPSIPIRLSQGNWLAADLDADEPVEVNVDDGCHFSLEEVTYESFLHQCGAWWNIGGEINWEVWYQALPFGRIPLPTYPFERKRFWIEPEIREQVEPSSPHPDDTTSSLSLQEKIMLTWKKHLAIEEIHPDDDFYFDLGGDSLTAVEIISDLKQEWDIHVSMQDFLNYSTPAALLERLEQTQVNETIIQKIKDGTQPGTLFLIHPAGGSIKIYHDLISHMNQYPTVYGISFPKDWENDSLPTIEEMAQRYIEEIKQLVPEGPYQLGGYSMGGNIAFEMALQLEALGEKVHDLIMIDSYVPSTYHGAQINEQAFQEAFPILANLLFRPEIQLKQEEYQELATMPLETMIHRLQEMDMIPAGMNPSDWISFFDLWRKNSLSLTTHHPEKIFSGNIILFDAMDPGLDSIMERLGISPEEKGKWREYIKGELNIISIPGNHYSIFNEKFYLQTLAHHLENTLQEIQMEKSIS